MAERILIFGGTFDPVHHGHLIVARAAAETLGLGAVVLVPAATPPHKAPASAPAQDRLEMLRRAVEGGDGFEVSDTELRRSGPSYTIDTLEEFRRERPGATLHLLIGKDMLEDLPAWHRARDVVQTAEIAVAARGSSDPGAAPAAELPQGVREYFQPETLRRLREGMLETPRIDISSTDVRRRVAERLSIRYLVPEPVDAYIRRRGLYAAGPERKEPPGA